MDRKLIATACAAGLLAASAPALATFHLMKVVEVFPGTAASPSAQYVVIQMYAAGQNFVSGHAITVFNGAGTLTGTFTFPGNLPNGANQAKILIATSQAETFFGLTADLVMSPTILSAGGKVCWAGTLDCVAWGAYTGGTAGVGTPFNAGTGLVSGRAARRRLDISGSASALDSGDDTDNSATDFVLGLPGPRNNAGVLGTPPMSTCGNGVVEGLEQCDDHNLVSGDGCSSTCLVDAAVTHHALGDFDGDGKTDVVWRNGTTGADALWRSGVASTQMPVTAVTNVSWHIVGKGDFNGDGKADLLWRNMSTGVNAIWKSALSSTQQAITGVTSENWQVAGVGDFDHDGKADIFWRNESTGADAIWKGAASNLQQAATTVADVRWHVVGIGDFDGDGHSDVFWRNETTGANAIWRSGISSQQIATRAVTDSDWHVVGVGDFDADGKSDVLWRNTSTGADAIWRSGNAATQLAVTGVTSQAWQVAQVGDFNGDGRADVFWRNNTTGANTIWKSAASSQQQATTGVTNLAWKVVPYEGQDIGASGSTASTPKLSIADVAVTEGYSGSSRIATFTVSLDHASSTAATYDIATANLTAIAGSDYTAASLVGQSIPAGTTRKAFSVTILGDAMVEPNETFQVNVSHVAGATVARGSAIGTIVDDDMSPYPG